MWAPWKRCRGSPRSSASSAGGWNSLPSGWMTPASTWPRRAALPSRPLELQAAAEPVGDPPSVRPRTRAAAHLEPHCLRGGFTGREILDDGLDLINTFALGRGPREWLRGPQGRDCCLWPSRSKTIAVPMACGELRAGVMGKNGRKNAPGHTSPPVPLLKYHTLGFDVFTKVPSRIAAALCAGNRCRSPESCETRDQFDATVTVNVALSMDWGFQTLTVSWSPAASGHIPL